MDNEDRPDFDLAIETAVNWNKRGHPYVANLAEAYVALRLKAQQCVAHLDKDYLLTPEGVSLVAELTEVFASTGEET